MSTVNEVLLYVFFFEKMRKGEDFIVCNCVWCSITLQLLAPFKLQEEWSIWLFWKPIKQYSQQMLWLMKHVNLLI